MHRRLVLVLNQSKSESMLIGISRQLSQLFTTSHSPQSTSPITSPSPPAKNLGLIFDNNLSIF